MELNIDITFWCGVGFGLALSVGLDLLALYLIRNNRRLAHRLYSVLVPGEWL